MIKIGNVEVCGWEAAIRGMRNPMNSWDKSDSSFVINGDYYTLSGSCGPWAGEEDLYFEIGENDHKLMLDLAKGGSVHAKYRRMIVVHLDILAPLYWWKEFDTYKVGTIANSCSTMHKIHEKEFTMDDFSHEHLSVMSRNFLDNMIDYLNCCRTEYLNTKTKSDWWQMIQLLPSSYNQRRTIMLNYEVLSNIYIHRKEHRLDEWRDFCKWIETLPYSEIITLEERQ